MLPASSGSPDSTIRHQRLSTGHVALFNTATQELILIEQANAGELAVAAVANAWGQASLMVGERRAVKLSQADLSALQVATQAVVLLSGTNDWPP